MPNSLFAIPRFDAGRLGSTESLISSLYPLQWSRLANIIAQLNPAAGRACWDALGGVDGFVNMGSNAGTILALLELRPPSVDAEDAAFIGQRAAEIQRGLPLVKLEDQITYGRNEKLYARQVALQYVEMAGRFWAIHEYTRDEWCGRVQRAL